ncbi:MAG: MFS transporter [Candidatus Omnitrophica bacterium]|nr:MFS transporter [Candidatus Omnitrophota bacterium]
MNLNRKVALGTVFLVVLVDLIGFGIVLPLLPFYASKFNASPVTIGLLYSIFSFAQLVFSPIWGALSDRIGRRPIMLLSTFGALVAYILFALSQSLTMLFVSRLVAGIMGGNVSTAQAYVADVTSPEDRAKGMGLIGAAFGIGFVIGPALSALLLMVHDHYALPGFFAAFLSAMSFLLVLFKLPETVDLSRGPDPTRIEKISIFTKRFWTSLFGRGNGILPLLLFSIFLFSLGQSSLYSGFPLFCKSELGLTAKEVGMQFVAMGLVTVLVQGGLIRLLVHRFREERLFLVGSILMVAGLGLIPFATSAPILTVYLSIMAIGASLNGPTLTSLISKKADPRRIGATLGGSQGLAALGRVIGPAWGGFLYAFSFRMPFLVTALILSTSIIIGLSLKES